MRMFGIATSILVLAASAPAFATVQDGEGYYGDDSYASPSQDDDEGGWDPAAVRSEDQAVDACAVAAERQGREYADGARVVDIVDVDRDSQGWVIDGTVELREGYRDSATREERFRCAVTFDGLRDVRIAGLDDS